MNTLRTYAPLALAALLVAAAACSKKTADAELALAAKAVAEARAKKAGDCAKETYQAAEAAIAEARKLAADGDVEAAKQRAGEAQALAEQASAASPEGCDEPETTEEVVDPNAARGTTNEASTRLDIQSLLQTVYFDYNEASIREDGKAVLSQVASAMKRDTGFSLEVEGHCDVRGSTEYNLHLGERRARSVVKYLVTQGVDPKQINVISYGEERPVDLGLSDDAHQKNRRAELVNR